MTRWDTRISIRSSASQIGGKFFLIFNFNGICHLKMTFRAPFGFGHQSLAARFSTSIQGVDIFNDSEVATCFTPKLLSELI